MSSKHLIVTTTRIRVPAKLYFFVIYETLFGNILLLPFMAKVRHTVTRLLQEPSDQCHAGCVTQLACGFFVALKKKRIFSTMNPTCKKYRSPILQSVLIGGCFKEPHQAATPSIEGLGGAICEVLWTSRGSASSKYARHKTKNMCGSAGHDHEADIMNTISSRTRTRAERRRGKRGHQSPT